MTNIKDLTTTTHSKEEIAKRIATASKWMLDKKRRVERQFKAVEKSRNKNKKKVDLKPGDFVFIKPPPPYRKMKDDKFVKKGKIEKEIGNYAFTVIFQETGGWLPSHKPFTKANVHKNNCKPYILGMDNILEPFDENLEKIVQEKEKNNELAPGSPYLYVEEFEEVEIQNPTQNLTQNEQEEDITQTNTEVDIESYLVFNETPLISTETNRLELSNKFPPNKTIVKSRKSRKIKKK